MAQISAAMRDEIGREGSDPFDSIYIILLAVSFIHRFNNPHISWVVSAFDDGGVGESDLLVTAARTAACTAWWCCCCCCSCCWCRRCSVDKFMLVLAVEVVMVESVGSEPRWITCWSKRFKFLFQDTSKRMRNMTSRHTLFRSNLNATYVTRMTPPTVVL